MGFDGPAWLPPQEPLAGTGLVLPIAPAIPTMDVPRAHPCQARGIGFGPVECGATPASLWNRTCIHGHSRDVWLCGVHAKQQSMGAVACSECIDRGAGHVAAILMPVHLVLADWRKERDVR